MKLNAPTNVLERIEHDHIQLDPVQDLPPEDVELGLEAYALFGYRILRQQNEQRQQDAQSGLLSELLTMGIKPFTDSSVKRYQTIVSKQFASHGRQLGTVLVIGAVAGLITMFSGIILWFGRRDVPSETLGWTGFFLTWLCAVSAAYFISTANRTRLEWKKSAIGDYDDELPRSVLVMATEIKKMISDCTISVEYMKLTRVPRPPFDPFLFVRLGGESYYVAAWDEPGFQAELIA